MMLGQADALCTGIHLCCFCGCTPQHSADYCIERAINALVESIVFIFCYIFSCVLLTSEIE